MAYLYQLHDRQTDKQGKTIRVAVLVGTETSVEMAQFLGSSLCPEPLIWWYDGEHGYYEGTSKWDAEHPVDRYRYVVSQFDLSKWGLCPYKVVTEE